MLIFWSLVRFFHTQKPTKHIFQSRIAAESEDFMAFFNSAVGVLQTLVIALGAGLGVWGVINLLERCGTVYNWLAFLRCG